MNRKAETHLRTALRELDAAAELLARSGTPRERQSGDSARLALRFAGEALGTKLCKWCGKEFATASRRSDAVYCCHQHAVNASTAAARARAKP
jgi:hypothetical protein